MASSRSAAWARACSTALAIVSIHPGNLLGRRGKCLARVPSCVSMLRELGQATALLGWRIPHLRPLGEPPAPLRVVSQTVPALSSHLRVASHEFGGNGDARLVEQRHIH